MRAFILVLFLLFSAVSSHAVELPFRQPPGESYFESPQAGLDSQEYDTFIARIEAQKSGDAKLLWAHHYDPRFEPSKSVSFSLRQGTHTYYINIPTQNPNWIGWIKGLVIYPEADLGPCRIERADLVQGGIFTSACSAWQEFWGPKGRTVVGSTINLIPSSAVFGKSINVYIYWMVGIFFAGYFCVQFARGNKSAFKETAGRAFMLALFCWLLLTLNSYANYWGMFKDNFVKYYGQGLEEKRAVAYGKEYYDFLGFARSKLPAQPVEFGIFSSKYAPDLQARIFLVPHVLTSNPDNDYPYLLVFYPKAEQKFDEDKYRVFARFNENAYILEREQ